MNEYEHPKGISRTAAYRIYTTRCAEQGITDMASFKTFCQYINYRPRYQSILRREGRKRAYNLEPEYVCLENTTPVHGEMPFQVGHIDHTQDDILVKDPVTGETFKPWKTILQEAFCRRILVVHMQRERPTKETVLLVFRECVRRFGRLPKFIVHDGGKEFSAVDVQAFMAFYRVGNKKRPPSKSRFGSPGERIFGTLNTMLLHNMAGNTKLTKNARQMSPEVDPQNFAVWTFDAYVDHVKEFCYEVYDKAEHSTLLCSPRVMFEQGMARAGNRTHKLISVDDPVFRALTLPSARRGTAKVQPSRGIKVDNVYYKHPLFSDPQIEGSRVEVKLIPEDYSTVLAFIGGKWEECHSQYYKQFKGLSRREIAQITLKIKDDRKASGYRRKTVTAKEIAEYLKITAIKETLLAAPELGTTNPEPICDEAAATKEMEYVESEIAVEGSDDDWNDDWNNDEEENENE